MKVSHTTRQSVMYVLALVVMIFGTIVLVAIAQGYSFDFRSGEIQSRGLVIIDSSPNGATITIDGKTISQKTPHHYEDAKSGTIQLKLEKQDYQKWQAIERVVASEVTFADYAILVPNIIPRQSIPQSSLYSQMVQADNRSRSIALSSTKDILYAITENGDSKQFYQLSDTDKQLGMQIIELQVSNDGSRVLVRQSTASGVAQNILVTVDSSKVLNLNEAYAINFTTLSFNPKNSSELFWLEAGTVRKLQTDNRSINQNIISSVTTFSPQSDRVLVVTTLPTNSQLSQLSSYDLNLSDKKDITNLNTQLKGYQLSFISSRNSEYVSIINNETTELVVIRDPYNKKISSVVAKNVSTMTHSPNGRFLVYLSNFAQHTIDLEFYQHYSYKTTYKDFKNWSWYNDFHLLVSAGNKISLVDYDGQNLYPLSMNDLALSFRSNSRELLLLNKSGGIDEISLTAAP